MKICKVVVFLLCVLCVHCVHLPASASVKFVDVTEAAGIRFRHMTGATGERYMPETMGSGCAFLDYDADNNLDINGGGPCETGERPVFIAHREDGQWLNAVIAEGFINIHGLETPCLRTREAGPALLC